MFANSIYASLFTALGIAFGFIIVELVDTPDPGPPPGIVAAGAAAPMDIAPMVTTITGNQDEIDELRRLLAAEKQAREDLAVRLATLDEKFARLDAAARSPAAAASPDNGAAAPEPAAADAERWFDEQALVASGMPAEQADELRRFFEQLELERLQLHDQAQREEWGRGRLRSELQSLEAREIGLRDRYGEAAYDAYLYASGKPNRVEITGVLGSAPAGQAGIQGGDYLLRYDNRPIYNPRDLREAIADGELSDTVEIEIVRNDDILRFYLTRGPLGVRLNPQRVAP